MLAARTRLSRRARLGTAVALAALAALAVPVASLAAGPLRTAIIDPTFFTNADPQIQAAAFDRVRGTGATMVRLGLNWSAVAPAERQAGFDPTNPGDPAYDWSAFDRQFRLAAERRLEPIVVIVGAPSWAGGTGKGHPGTVKPDPAMFGQFARAAAVRYSGAFGGLPRVRFWQAWNEPNRDYFLMPQIENGTIVSAIHYRAMVRSFTAAVKGVSSSNVVLAGGLAPLGRPGKPPPLSFMRTMLCVSRTLARTCNLRSNPVRFDVWTHHPYTSGGPTHSAQARDDVSLGDLPEMRQLLKAAVRLGHARPQGSMQFWVTEFSWDSKPPDPQALPAALHARWTSEALYRMWQNGVSVVTWFRIQDDPLRASPYQSGFFTDTGARKRSLTAFRFPLVAFKQKTGVYVWGRTPTSRAARVVVELKAGSRWRRLGTIRASGSGIFAKTFRTPFRKGAVRARAFGETSLPFSLTPVRDRYVNPFGCGGAIRC